MSGNQQDNIKKSSNLVQFVDFGFPAIKIAPHIWGRYIKLLNENFEFVIIIDENLKSETIKNGIPKILEHRDSLKDTDGFYIKKYEDITTMVAELRNLGWSYAEIAREFNYDCTLLLCRYADDNANDAEKVFALMELKRLLEAFRIRDSTIRDIFLDIFENRLQMIRNGEAPWYPVDEPIKKENVIYKVKVVQDELSSEELELIKKLPIAPLSKIRWEHPATLKYQDMANRLLRKSYPDYMENYQEAHNDRINRVMGGYKI
jgi:hypothetical protein